MPVFIAGMHRSGTSMVTKILHEAGLYLGSESDLIPTDPNKGEGHWENKRFVKINRAILDQLGGAWDCPPPIPDDWTGSRLAPYRAESEALLADFVGREPWGWKDPRNCLTLPFWQAIVGAVPVVIIVRNPLEVAGSLRRRNRFSRALGLALWQAYNQRLSHAIAKPHRIVTHYDMHFQDPAGELRRILSFLGLAADEKTIETASAAQSAELRHHRLTTQDLRNAGAPLAILDLYRDLCEEANWLDTGQGDPSRVRRLEDDPPPFQDDPASSQATARADGRPGRHGARGRLRQQLEEALARIAELQQTIEEQRLELARERRSSRS